MVWHSENCFFSQVMEIFADCVKIVQHKVDDLPDHNLRSSSLVGVLFSQIRALHQYDTSCIVGSCYYSAVRHNVAYAGMKMTLQLTWRPPKLPQMMGTRLAYQTFPCGESHSRQSLLRKSCQCALAHLQSHATTAHIPLNMSHLQCLH